MHRSAIPYLKLPLFLLALVGCGLSTTDQSHINISTQQASAAQKFIIPYMNKGLGYFTANKFNTGNLLLAGGIMIYLHSTNANLKSYRFFLQNEQSSLDVFLPNGEYKVFSLAYTYPNFGTNAVSQTTGALLTNSAKTLVGVPTVANVMISSSNGITEGNNLKLSGSSVTIKLNFDNAFFSKIPTSSTDTANLFAVFNRYIKTNTLSNSNYTNLPDVMTIDTSSTTASRMLYNYEEAYNENRWYVAKPTIFIGCDADVGFQSSLTTVNTLTSSENLLNFAKSNYSSNNTASSIPLHYRCTNNSAEWVNGLRIAYLHDGIIEKLNSLLKSIASQSITNTEANTILKAILTDQTMGHFSSMRFPSKILTGPNGTMSCTSTATPSAAGTTEYVNASNISNQDPVFIPYGVSKNWDNSIYATSSPGGITPIILSQPVIMLGYADDQCTNLSRIYIMKENIDSYFYKAAYNMSNITIDVNKNEGIDFNTPNGQPLRNMLVISTNANNIMTYDADRSENTTRPGLGIINIGSFDEYTQNNYNALLFQEAIKDTSATRTLTVHRFNMISLR